MEKRYDHMSSEQRARQLWNEHKTYAVDTNADNVFSIDTPPPTVSGKLHIGHIFSYTQQDIIARYKRMNGCEVYYPFGFDDNGLPTERLVEKRRKITAAQVGRSEFIKACLEETREVERQFEELWKHIGLSVDWDKCYSTISDSTRKISQASFIDLYKKDFIYRKNEPALYCTAFRTTVAQAELEDVEKETLFSDISFSTEDGDELVIGTTRPELLPSCVAMFYNPDDARYQHLKGKKAIVPVYGHRVPIIADEKAQINKGTGLVMCCTFGDTTDIEWYKKHKLPYRQSIGFDGKWLDSTGPLAGLKVHAAREKILEILDGQGLVKSQKKIVHVVSVYERSKREIEYLMLPQWFLKILPFKEKLVALADEINWYPSFMKARYIDWVENLQWDWCLSRQRFFGVPFPVWYDKETGDVVLPQESDLPVDPQEQKYPGDDARVLVPDTDVMDTWNTSSLTPYLNQAMFEGSDNLFGEGSQRSHFLPMGMRPQAHDIIRTWAFYTIIKTWMHHGMVPWKNIVISGHVLSSSKEKISKSRGNNPLEPENLFKNYSADVIRYWTASGSLGHDVAFSENKLKIGSKLAVKLWNACRFVSEHIQNFDPKESVVSRDQINEWIVHRATETRVLYDKYFEKFEFSLALGAFEQFFWHDFCDNYLELIKDRLFNPDTYSEQEVQATRATLYNVMLRILQFLAPYMPHITEVIYQDLFKKEMGESSLHRTQFDAVHEKYNYPESAQSVAYLLDVVAQVRKLKSDNSLSLKTEIAQLTVVASQEIINVLKPLEHSIKGVCKVVDLQYDADGESGASSGLESVSDSQWNARVSVS